MLRIPSRTLSTTQSLLSHSVVIGGNTAALIAVKTLKRLDPAHKVTIVSPNDHTFAPPVTPRLLVKPELIPEATHPFKSILKDMEFNHVKGMATQLSPDSNLVSVKLATGEKEDIAYDNVIVCSGARSKEPIYKIYDSWEKSVEALKQMHHRLQTAKKVAVLGGGATGVETSAEIKEKFNLDVDLYSGDVHPTMMFNHSGISSVETKLAAIDVKLINNVRPKVLDRHRLEADGEVHEYDIIIDATGVKPNNEFIPENLLDHRGYLKCDSYFRTKYDNVFGLGDILSVTTNTLVDLLYYQTEVFKPLVLSKIFDQDVNLVKYNDNHAMTCAIPITSKMGVGEFVGFRIPSFLVVLSKSRDYMISKTANIFEQF